MIKNLPMHLLLQPILLQYLDILFSLGGKKENSDAQFSHKNKRNSLWSSEMTNRKVIGINHKHKRKLKLERFVKILSAV